MKIKKLLSLILVVLLLCCSVSASFESIAANSVSVDSFIDSVEELNAEEAEEEKTLEESAGSRVIVKSLQKPETFGNAEYIKGTYGKHIFQYATEEEATEAVEHYRSLSGVVYAVRDSLVESQEIPYGEAMLGTQRAKEYIANNDIPTSSIKIAVIDTGIDFTHDLFKDNPRIFDSGVNMTDTGTTDSALDDEQHGSLCSEIVMDNTADDVSIIGYKVLNSNGSGTNLWVATGIEKAVEDGVNVINLSLGGEAEPDFEEETSIVLDDAVRYAISKGVIVVAASGNNGMDAKLFSPANVEGVITVGAIDKAGNHAYFSNFGDCVDFVAPGVEIEHDYVFPGYNNEPVDGTSFSSPYVVSEICTLLSVFPNLSVAEIKNKLAAVSVPYEHLHYHDNFHPIYEDQGMFILYENLRLKYEPAESDSLFYANGMPQIDLAIMYPDDFERNDMVSFSVDSGHYVDEEFDLFLSSNDDAEIYYTQDESYPSKENGIKYNGSIHIDELQSVRAVALSESKAPSFFSAREYRMEYNAPESDFTFVETQRKSVSGEGIITYHNVITEYLGTQKNIIVPDTINGKAVQKVDIKTPNTLLTSVTLPDSCTIMGRYKKHTDKLVYINGVGLEGLNCIGRYYSSLIEINAPNIQSITIQDCYVRELYLPNARKIFANSAVCLKSVFAPSLLRIPALDAAGYFENCYSLENFNASQLESIGDKAFSHCYKLKDFETNNVKKIGRNALVCTYCMRKMICPNLQKITGLEPFCYSNINYLYAPKLETMSYPHGTFNWYYEDGEVLDYSKYNNSKLIVSSEWVECERDAEGNDRDPLRQKNYFYHHNLDIYGTPNTYAEEYANQFHLKFIPLPLLESEPDNMGYQSDGNITADILGFNKEYQWYGTNRKDNHGGSALTGETSEDLDTSKYNFKYYYCKVKTSDGDYKKDIITGESNINIYNFNADGIIDIQDVSMLLTEYGNSANANTEMFDLNEDNVIDLSDLSIELSSDIYGAVA